MKECTHSNTYRATVERELSGHVFKAQALVCSDCGAELWDNKVSIKFNDWLTELGLKPRIQFRMSHVAQQCLDEILLKFPGSNKTVLVRAMIAVYLHFLQRGASTNDIFNEIFDSSVYQSFNTDSNTPFFTTDVRAFFYFDIQSWGKSFDLKPNEIASEAFHLMMALCVSEDAKLKEFWNKVVFPQIETIIKAA